MSDNCPFHWQGTPLHANWGSIIRGSNNAAASTATVARKRMEGNDPGAVEGISQKGNNLIDVFAQTKHGGAYSRADKAR